MNIVLVHNHYQHPSGEDVVVRSEKELLTAAGHQVTEYARHNDEIKHYGLRLRAMLAFRTVWAWDSLRDLRAILNREKADVAHFHNTLPLISPAAYYACREAGVPVVQTLHNYRLFCPAPTFFRNGQVCEECVQHSLWRGVRYGCYHGSRLATATVALMLAVHRVLGTWTRRVDCYIALTEFARQKFVEAGLPAEQIVVKPNFVYPDPGKRNEGGDYALFAGRLAPEKGLGTLLDAWQRLRNNVPLEILGDGPLGIKLQEHAASHGPSNVRFRGRLTGERTLEAMKGARVLVFPSQWYEGFPMVIAEAYASGVPVIASRLGAMAEIVEDGRTGLHFTPGDPEDLAAKVEWAWTHPKEMEVMGRAARAEYEAKYTAEHNYPMLMGIYQRAITAQRGSAPRT